MSTIPDRALWFLESEVKSLFVGYSCKRVSSHLEYVECTSKMLMSFKSFCGVKYKKQYATMSKKILFSNTFIKNYKWREFMIKCAVDENKKKIYWQAERTYSEMEWS
jgi:hypothetical protein